MPRIDERDKMKFSVFQDERFIDLNLYQFGWQRCKPLYAFGPYVRNHYLFHYVISGKGVLESCGQHYPIRAGQGFLICPNQITAYIADQDDPWEYTWIEFDGLVVPGFLRQAGLSDKQPVFTPCSSELAKQLELQMLAMLEHGSASALRLIGQGYLFLDLLVRGSGHKQPSSGKKLRDFYMKEALSFIEQHYMHNISVEDISDFCGLDRSYFGRIFRDTLGASPQRFLMLYRMAKAEQLLKESRISISEISAMVGYENPLHFSRAFKGVYEIPPREYRQRHFNPPET